MDETPKYELRHISKLVTIAGVKLSKYTEARFQTNSVLDFFKELKINTWRRGLGSDILFEGNVVAHTRHFEAHLKSRTQKDWTGATITIRPTFKRLLEFVEAEKTNTSLPRANMPETG